MRLFAAFQELIRGKLRRSGLPADFDTGQSCAGAGACSVDHTIHPLHYFLDVQGIERPLSRLLVVTFHQMRLVPSSSHGEAAHGVRELQGCNCQIALADGHRNRLSGIPLLAKRPYLPLGGWHDSFRLVGQIDARTLSEAGLLGVEGNPVDAKPHTYVVKVNVAGLFDPAMKRNGSMPGVAFVKVPVKARAATAANGKG